jgi:CRP-like cAMP-binding protein
MQVQPDQSAFVADQELIQALMIRAIEMSCGKDCVLFRQGDAPAGLYIVNKGEAVLTLESPAGESVKSFTAPAGSILGLPALIGNQPYSLTAVAFAGASLSFVTREDFMILMQTDPQLPLRILPVLAAELRSARRTILEM